MLENVVNNCLRPACEACRSFVLTKKIELATAVAPFVNTVLVLSIGV